MQKTVLITGTSSGIGEGLAAELISRGFLVAGISRRRNPRLENADAFRFCQLDLSKHEQVSARLGEFFCDLPGLDLVVLNAGILGRIGDMSDTPLAELKRVMDVNVWANKSVLDAVFGHFEKVAQVVSISSGAAVNGNRGWNGYSISKAALNMLTQLYAREQPETHFCSLAPGLVDTAMQDYLCGLGEDPRFAALAKIQSARNTDDMPNPGTAAPKLAEAILALPGLVASGSFADIRQLNFPAN